MVGKPGGGGGHGGRVCGWSWQVMNMDMDIHAYGGPTWAWVGGRGDTNIPWNGFTKKMCMFS